ncbi:hypothetical protein DPSP01_004060 [Paraphaeosphaeria sporulosa]|uniref:Uncharacterized protein n=1 Tax=Paraphaeosphaeria sporulosa TaxID=1460663 RepID=A0A177CTL3_9PLEO|nr:uncharacterized protein CC84DRAFT_496745 [Paraphaeosphaeria sporulosa]OAG10874.1 hypothetical protein CC84DRAFT_496745 [Paraphaeosphaeria sporulosa]
MKFLIVFLATAAIVLSQDTVSATGAACEPHGDHWHCPSGVPEPTIPPAAEPPETGASATAPATVSTANSANAATTEASTCEPHGDHWHCPSGVSEPITPPPATATGEDHDHDEDDHDHEATASTCEPHGDHWHCPSGVAEPTFLPAETTSAASTTGTASGANLAESAAATSSQFGGAGVAGRPGDIVQMAAAGILGLLVL